MRQVADTAGAVADAVPPSIRLVPTRTGPHVTAPRGHSRQWPTLLSIGGAYLVLSMALWSHVWFWHPASVTICGCGDPSGAAWVMEWPAYAIAHGLNPLYSTAMGFPRGINLLANASILAFGVVLAPITWAFGPIASLNVALTLSPALSALAMFLLLRRWVSWRPAAFAGGLLYGFSPFILVMLSATAINFGMGAVPPLIVLCLDELVVRRRRKPLLLGVALGLLLVLQFFIGTEVLLFTVMFSAFGTAVVLVSSAWKHPDRFGEQIRRSLIGLGAAATSGLVVLVYPLWFALAGPAHYAGPIWPGGIFAPRRNERASLALFVEHWSVLERTTDSRLWHAIGGYQGTPVSWQYLGAGLVAVLVIGLVAFRRDHKLLLFASIGVVALLLSLGASRSAPLPWQMLAGLPLFENVTPWHFVFVVYFAVAAMLALIVDDAYHATMRWTKAHRADRWLSAEPTGRAARPPVSAALFGLAVIAVALAQPAAYMAETLPFAARPVVLPNWFRTVAPHLRGRQVLLVLPGIQPYPLTSMATPVAWQAVNRMHYSMVNSLGPSSLLSSVAKPERPGASVLANVTSFYGTPQTIDTKALQDVRAALQRWGVTMVVMPDEPDLPQYYQVASMRDAAALISAATGEIPTLNADSWVWSAVNSAPAVVHLDATTFSRCTGTSGTTGTNAVLETSRCVVDAGSG